MLVLVFLTTFAVLVGSFLLYSHHDSRSRPHGPRAHGLGFILPLILGKIGKVHEIFLEWNVKYGSFTSFKVLTLWIYLTSDINFIREIFLKTEIFPTRGSNGIRYFIPKSLLGLENCDALWKQHRNIIIGAFTETYLKKYSEEIILVGKRLEENLLKNGLVVNINDTMANVAYEVLSNTVMGKDWLEVFPSAGTKPERDAALHTANFLTNIPEFLWKIIPYGPKALADRAMYEIRSHATTMIRQIRENNQEGNSMLHFLAKHESNLPENEIIDELLSLTMAGHETTANTLSFAFVALSINPKIQEKAREEIKKLETEGIQITYKKINHLPYCWAIFREALRLFPTVPITPRMVEEDFPHNGFIIPKGCRILVNNLAVCRSEEYFKNPLEFNPDRWGMDDKELRNYDMTRNFGGGMRLCIGKRFAEEESILLLAMILSKFKITLRSINEIPVKDSSKVVLTEIPTIANVTLSFEHPIALYFEPI